MPLSARLGPPKPFPESPRIKALRDAVMGGNQQSTDAFWQEGKLQGAPIIEPLPGDDKNMLVTFLWQGGAETHKVFVIRLPYAGGSPNDFLWTDWGRLTCGTRAS